MKILMLTWEFPPLISGGLGTACYGIAKGLLKKGIEIDLLLPTEKNVYFPLRKPEDADELPVRYLSQPAVKEYIKEEFRTRKEKLEYVGLNPVPESYYNISEFKTYFKEFSSSYTLKTKVPFIEMINDLKGSEDIFQKVKEYTVRAEKAALNGNYDLIHAHDWLTYTAGIVCKSVTGKKLVTHMHATEFDRSGGGGDKRIHNIEYNGMSEADSVITVSKYTSEMVISRYLIDTGKINVVHNAHNINIKDDTLRKRMFRDPVVLFLGRITIQKGPDYFLEAARRILKEFPNVRFVMAGAGDMQKKILHRSAEYGLKNRFLFTGFLNTSHVEEMFLNSDIYVLSSVSEPFGIAPLEAMSYGIASIISKQSGVAEVIENARKVDFWDVELLSSEILRLLRNDDERKALGEAGRKEVERIKWDKACEKIIDIYKKIINNG